MTELQRILAASISSPGVLATVVNVDGSAYRRPGARMFVAQSGDTTGTISGGCLEADVIERAWQLTEGTQPHLIRYDSRQTDPDSVDDDWGFGMGCNGAVDVLLERIDPQNEQSYLRFLREMIAGHRPCVVGTVFSSTDTLHVGQRICIDAQAAANDNLSRVGIEVLASGASSVRAIEGARVFFEYVAPPPVLLICGAGHDAIPLAQLASMTGWCVYICDRREMLANAERFPQAAGVFAETFAALPHPPDAAVVMTHRYPEDMKLLPMLLKSPARYIGILGPRDRTHRLLRSVGCDGEALGDRLHAPVGLDLGAETPEEIALAILAEATATLHRCDGGKLRDSGGPIHADRVSVRLAAVPQARS